MVSYQIDDELHERVRHAKIKYTEGDAETCQKMLERLYQILNQQTKSLDNTELRPIIPAEIRAHLLMILSDLEHFDIKKGQEDMDLLHGRRIPDHYLVELNQIEKYLDDYDDVSAEERIRSLLLTME